MGHELSAESYIMKVESEEQPHPHMFIVESTIKDNVGPSKRPADFPQPRKKRRLNRDGALPDNNPLYVMK